MSKHVLPDGRFPFHFDDGSVAAQKCFSRRWSHLVIFPFSPLARGDVSAKARCVGDLKFHCPCPPPGPPSLVASLGRAGRRRVVLAHTLNTHTLRKPDEQQKALRKLTTLCWAEFLAVLDHTWPAAPGGAPCRTCVLSRLTFESFIHFELILVRHVSCWYRFILCVCQSTSPSTLY